MIIGLQLLLLNCSRDGTYCKELSFKAVMFNYILHKNLLTLTLLYILSLKVERNSSHSIYTHILGLCIGTHLKQTDYQPPCLHTFACLSPPSSCCHLLRIKTVACNYFRLTSVQNLRFFRPSVKCREVTHQESCL